MSETNDQEQAPTRERLPHPVYHVSCGDDSSVLIGMNVWTDSNNMVSWFDTVRQRLMRGTIIEKTPERLAFRREERAGGQTYLFVPMSLDIYNSTVRNHLRDSQSFDDEQSMIDALLQSIKNAW